MDSSLVDTSSGAKCCLHKLPPELRWLVFIQAAEHTIYGDGVSRRISYPSENYDLGKLLDASAEEIEGHIKGLTALETALLRRHKDLYFECLHARLSVSALRLFPIHDQCPQSSSTYTIDYPIFGRDIPLCLLKNVRDVVYEPPPSVYTRSSEVT